MFKFDLSFTSLVKEFKISAQLFFCPVILLKTEEIFVIFLV